VAGVLELTVPAGIRALHADVNLVGPVTGLSGVPAGRSVSRAVAGSTAVTPDRTAFNSWRTGRNSVVTATNIGCAALEAAAPLAPLFFDRPPVGPQDVRIDLKYCGVAAPGSFRRGTSLVT
jgi:hypothetical protein